MTATRITSPTADATTPATCCVPQRQGFKFIANKGTASIQAQNDGLELLAKQGLDISSTEDEIRITAKKKITLNSGNNYITIDPYRIEIGSPGEVEIKAPHFDYVRTSAQLKTPLPPLADPLGDVPNKLALGFYDALAKPVPDVGYLVTFDNGQTLQGKLDEQGNALHSPVPERPAKVQYKLPEPEPGESWAPYDLLDQKPRTAGKAELQDSGPGVWVTKDYDYLGLANTAIGLLNRLTTMGDEGRAVGSDGKDFKNTMRDVIQEWQPLSEDAPSSLVEKSVKHKYGTVRRKRQKFLEGNDNWAVSGSSWHWVPVIANKEFEAEE